MKKERYMKDLNEIQNIANQIRTINEAISFGDNYDDYENMPDEESEGQTNLGKMNPKEMEQSQQVPMGNGDEKPEDIGMQQLDQSGELDQIREITLKGMIKLCKNPEDPTYQALKKIFTMVDKGVEKENKEQQM